MTPAIKILEQNQCSFTVHRYAEAGPQEKPRDSNIAYGKRAAEQLALNPEQVFKTLVLEVAAKAPVIALVPVSRQLNLKALARIIAAKKIKMMDRSHAEKISGYLIGGICPLGFKRKLKVIIDSSMLTFHHIFISAGQRGLELEMDSADLITLTDAQTADIT